MLFAVMLYNRIDMYYYDLLYDNPTGLWPLDNNSGTVFTDMSGYDMDAISSDLINYITNPSAENATGTIAVRTNLHVNPVAGTNAAGFATWGGTGGVASAPVRQTSQTGWPYAITTSVRATWTTGTTAISGGIYTSTFTGLTPTHNYAGFASVRCSKAQRFIVGIEWYTSASVFVSGSYGTAANVAANTSQSFNVNGVVPAGADRGLITIYPGSGAGGSNWAVNDWMEVTMVHFEKTNAVLVTSGADDEITQPFVASFPAGTFGPDYSYVWTGAAHGSASNMLAPALTSVNRYGTPIAIPHQSTENAQSGTKSLCVRWDNATSYTQAAGFNISALTIGTQYVFSMYTFVPAGCSDVSAWNSSQAGSVYSPVANSGRMSTKDQWIRVYITWTAGVTTASVGVITNTGAGSSTKGTDRCYVDRMMLEVGSTPSAYVDGSFPGAIWSGIPHQSSTTTTDLQFVEPVAARGGSAIRIRDDHTLSFALSGVLQQGKESKPAAIEFWIKNENLTGTFNFGVLSKFITLTGSNIVFDLGGTNIITAENVVEAGLPIHVVALYNSTLMSLYVNKVLVGTVTVLNPDFTTFTQGSLMANATTGRVATLDMVSLYNYNLTTEAIQRHYDRGVQYFSVTNNAAALKAFYIEFDDAHLPVAFRTTDEYSSIMTNLRVIDNQIQTLFDDTTNLFIAGEYLHLIQFDDQVYGMAANARIDWEVDGNPANVTVESSKDNLVWAPVPNHGMTTNWDDLMDGNDYFLRFTFASSAAATSVWGLSITMYSNLQYTSSDTTVTAQVANNVATTGYFNATPGSFKNRDGVNITTASGGLVVGAHPAFGNGGAIEMFIKPFTNVGTLFASGTNRIYKDATGLHFTGFSRVMVNGAEVFDGDETSSTVGWKHVVATFTTANDAISYIGRKVDGTDSLSALQLGYLAFHSSQLTVADAKLLYDAYVGAAPYRISDVTKIKILEPAYSGPGNPFKLYAMDWSITGGGA